MDFINSFNLTVRDFVLLGIMLSLMLIVVITFIITINRIKAREEKVNFSLPKLTNKTDKAMKEKKHKLKKNKRIDVNKVIQPTSDFDISDNINDLFETKAKKSIIHLPKVEIEEEEKDDLDITLEEIKNL